MRRPRRELTVAVLACAAGAALALLAATRTWTSAAASTLAAPVVPRRVAQTGSDLEPWLTALSLVGLAGAGALLATRGRGRVVLGVLLAAAGLGVLAGGVDGLTVADVRPAWPVLAIVGALLIGFGGGLTVARGRGWPAMGSRYEPPGVPRTPAEDRPQYIGPSRSDVAMWDALDRGEDPTRRGE